MKNLPILVLFFLFISKQVYSEEILAPFGFNWGLTKIEIEELGIQFTNCKAIGIIESCQTNQPIKKVSFGSIYGLYFSKNRGLNKIVMASNTITADIAGTQGINLYREIKNSLIEKYGPPESYEYVGGKVYKEYDEFYQCLKYSGCGAWMSLWNPVQGGALTIELEGISRGKGSLVLTYESKNWGKIVDLYNKTKGLVDKEAL